MKMQTDSDVTQRETGIGRNGREHKLGIRMASPKNGIADILSHLVATYDATIYLVWRIERKDYLAPTDNAHSDLWLALGC